MPPAPGYNLLGVTVHATNYAAAVETIVEAAKAKRAFSCSALAVHGVMTAAMHPPHSARLNTFDLITPDGQPVRWALNWLHGARLADRVYGPFLTHQLCYRAASEGLRLFFYGSDEATLASLARELRKEMPNLQIVGLRPSRFRRATEQEWLEDAEAIRRAQPDIVFCGLGCPRQEIWVYEMREYIRAPLIAVGAAFPFLARRLAMAPRVMQRLGFEWLFRLCREPLRLWRRYLLLNPLFVFGVLIQKFGKRYGKKDEKNVIVPAERWS
ncbi:MAG TPA: WecB/TagA/CpsF family glycosyltransferase [Opitutaceae bacterium]|nr:WecB/TagA/CpsF family glycosyltransferase [Opitutaceae bacterium]